MLNSAFLLSAFVVALMGLAAYLEGNFTSAQMAARGLKNGFPFLRHTGMWGDLFLVTPALGIICQYWKQWSSGSITLKLAIAFVVSIGLHIVWSAMTNVQEHICGPRLTFTWSGVIHALYLTGALAIVLLFYFNTATVQPQDIWIVTTLLMLHIPLANAFVGYMKSGHFDAPGVIGTIVLMIALGFAAVKMV